MASIAYVGHYNNNVMFLCTHTYTYTTSFTMPFLCFSSLKTLSTESVNCYVMCMNTYSFFESVIKCWMEDIMLQSFQQLQTQC